MKPGFLALFKRGHFSRKEDREETARKDRGCNQTERFTAAMIAFGLHYDESFQDHFFKKICNWERDSSKRNFSVLIEPGDSSDLFLENKKNRELFVIELKLGAKLDFHQNPESPLFWAHKHGKRGKHGYASQIVRDHGKKFKKIYYITLEKQRSWNKVHPIKAREYKNLKCDSKEWIDLRKTAAEESPIEKAIFDFLETQGIPAFVGRNMKMKIQGSETIGGAAHVLNLLRFAMGPHWRPEDLSVSPPGESEVYFGVNLTPKALYPASKLISKAAKPKSVIGWLGYDILPGNVDREMEPSVYLYCETKRAAIWVETYMKGNRKARYKTRIFVDGATFNVRIWTNREHCNDVEWFQKTISRLRDVPC